MTQTPTPRTPFGQALGEAFRSAHAAHLARLHTAGSTFLEWVTLNLVAPESRGVRVRDLERRLTDELAPGAEAIDAVVDGLLASGRARLTDDDGETRIVLTPRGHEHHDRVRGAVGELTRTLLADVDGESLRRTVDVLVTVKERASALREP